jgi:hypothetical protein
MVLHDLNWLSKIGKAAIATNKKSIAVKPKVDNPMSRFPNAETASNQHDVPAILVKE